MRAISAVVLLCFLFSACFSYAPTQTTPRPAAAVRLQLASPGEFRLTNMTAIDVHLVDGELIRATEDTIYLSASRLIARSGYDFVAAGETVRVPRSNVAVVNTQRVSLLRSALFIGGILFSIIVTSQLALGGEGSGEDGGGPPATQ